MTQALVDLLSTPWSYAVILGIAALDALVPVVPSETLAITGGVLAALGDLDLGTVIAAAAIGAFVGDSSAYLLGRGLGRPAREQLSGHALAATQRTHASLIAVSADQPPGSQQ